MTISQIKRTFAIAGILLASAPIARAADQAIVVLDAQGKTAVRVSASSPWAAAEKGMKLQNGTEIRTGKDGIVDIAFSDGSKIEIGPTTLFTIEAASTSKVFLRTVVGRLTAWVSKVQGRSFETASPVSVAAVRGTKLERVSFAPTQGMGVQIAEGTLHVSNGKGFSDATTCFEGSVGVTDNTGHTTSVNGGQSLSTTSSGSGAVQASNRQAPPPPPGAPPPPLKVGNGPPPGAPPAPPAAPPPNPTQNQQQTVSPSSP